MKLQKVKLLCKQCEKPMFYTGQSKDIYIPPYPEKEEEFKPAIEEKVVNTLSINRGKPPPNIGLSPFEKIKEHLGKKDNAVIIEKILTERELSYLLKRGDIYEPRAGTYEYMV